MYGITREQQDEYSLLSHQRACKAIEAGLFKDEIVPVEIKTRKGMKIFDTDEHANPNATLEIAAIIMMSADKAKELGLKPLGVRIIMAAINELNRRGGRYACATMCASGGPGCAFIVERMP